MLTIERQHAQNINANMLIVDIAFKSGYSFGDEDPLIPVKAAQWRDDIKARLPGCYKYSAFWGP